LNWSAPPKNAHFRSVQQMKNNAVLTVTNEGLRVAL